MPPVPYALRPSRHEKKYMCPLDPSCPLSQRKVYVKILCVKTWHRLVNVEFIFIFGR